jgi:hypothetical protein
VEAAFMAAEAEVVSTEAAEAFTAVVAAFTVVGQEVCGEAAVSPAADQPAVITG